jgi:hypothetical protein
MRRRETFQAGIGSLLLILGVLLATLPKDWIEYTVRVEPDAGSGTLELLIALAAVVVGFALIVPIAFRQIRARRRPASKAEGGGALPPGG